MNELSIHKGADEVMRYPLNKETTTIGRSNQNDICLPDASVSRLHVTILRKDDQFIATDQSTNGTFVNDRRISSCELTPNDVLRVGPWTLRFLSEGQAVEETTMVTLRDPTKILSFRPERNELVLERAVLELEGEKGRVIPITTTSVGIGKAKSNDIVLNDDFVSSFHCKVENVRGTYFLKDLGSTNGTLLNGNKVVEAEIPSESVIEVGRSRIRFRHIEESRKLETAQETEFHGIHSKDPKMRQIFSLIKRVAPADVTVLITGETGTGKELVSRALHVQSPRSRGAFVAINCGAISKDLIESELFGHEKGAFTSAHQQRRGVFEQANGGTLFLDEIGELPLELQPKLLRVLETGEIKRVGGTQSIHVDVRVVAATHRDLPLEVRTGRFREDLFYRLYVVPIHLPPLRERPNDIPLLVQDLLKESIVARPGAARRIDPEAMDRLIDYPWPGNVRELKNVIGRAILNCSTDTIGSGDLQFSPLGLRERTEFEADEDTLHIPQTITRSLRDVEKDRILSELRRNNWNKKETAKVLGIAKSTLHEKIKKYGLGET